MQLTRVASFLLFVLSLGFMASASPINKEVERATAAVGANDAAALAIGAALAAKVNADIAVFLGLFVDVNVEVAVFAEIFAILNVDIGVAVKALAALPKASAGVQIEAIATVYADILLALFPALAKVEVVAGLSAAYFPALEVQINALLAGLNVGVYGVLSVIGVLAVNLNVYLVGGLDIFVNVLGLLGIGIIIIL